MSRTTCCCLTFVVALLLCEHSASSTACAADLREITAESEQALQRGIQWLTSNQEEGNWGSNDLGLVSMGALAYLSAGHMPGRGRHGNAAQQALDYVVRNVKPSGLLNIAGRRRDMYNHGLSAFVLGQAYGMSANARIGPVLDRSLKLIVQTQCQDGGWDYIARPQQQGHDLSLAVMQAKALRSAVDSGLEVPPEVIEAAIRSVREHYAPTGCSRDAPQQEQKKHDGQFTYKKDGDSGSVAMSAAGVVCLQEFAQYDDWRIAKGMKVVCQAIDDRTRSRSSTAPFDAYTLYYVGQALYQVGGKDWQRCYPKLRDALVACQIKTPDDPSQNGKWAANGQVGDKPGDLYMTAAACFVLAMPNRYLPILQEGKIGSLQERFAE